MPAAALRAWGPHFENHCSTEIQRKATTANEEKPGCSREKESQTIHLTITSMEMEGLKECKPAALHGTKTLDLFHSDGEEDTQVKGSPARGQLHRSTFCSGVLAPATWQGGCVIRPQPEMPGTLTRAQPAADPTQPLDSPLSFAFSNQTCTGFSRRETCHSFRTVTLNG